MFSLREGGGDGGGGYEGKKPFVRDMGLLSLALCSKFHFSAEELFFRFGWVGGLAWCHGVMVSSAGSRPCGSGCLWSRPGQSSTIPQQVQCPVAQRSCPPPPLVLSSHSALGRTVQAVPPGSFRFGWVGGLAWGKGGVRQISPPPPAPPAVVDQHIPETDAPLTSPSGRPTWPLLTTKSPFDWPISDACL